MLNNFKNQELSFKTSIQVVIAILSESKIWKPQGSKWISEYICTCRVKIHEMKRRAHNKITTNIPVLLNKLKVSQQLIGQLLTFWMINGKKSFFPNWKLSRFKIWNLNLKVFISNLMNLGCFTQTLFQKKNSKILPRLKKKWEMVFRWTMTSLTSTIFTQIEKVRLVRKQNQWNENQTLPKAQRHKGTTENKEHFLWHELLCGNKQKICHFLFRRPIT